MFRRRRHTFNLEIEIALILASLRRLEAIMLELRGTSQRMEINMSQELDALNEIKTKLAAVHADVKARLDVVAGELSAEGKTEVENIKGALDAFGAEIGDADGSDTETPPASPTL